MEALRTPKAHANLVITQAEAIRMLMFVSMLMYKLDSAQFDDGANHIAASR